MPYRDCHIPGRSGPTIPGTQNWTVCLLLELELELGLLQSLWAVPFLVQNWTVCLLLKLELELGLLQPLLAVP